MARKLSQELPFDEESAVKNEIRDLIPRSAKERDIQPQCIFTLPSAKMLDVPYFKEYYPNTPIYGVERDRDAAETIRQDGRVEIFEGELSDYATTRHKLKHHGIAFLDFMSYGTPEIFTLIKQFVANPNLIHSDKRAIVAVTLCHGSRGNLKAGAVEYAQETLGDRSIEMIDEVTASCLLYAILAEVRPHTCRIDISRRYRAKADSSDMQIHLFEV